MQATVGAGLPVLATLKHLRETGDAVLAIDGILSGTLSHVLREVAAGVPFSAAVAAAAAAGYTEADPRADLSGADVARKVGCRTHHPSSSVFESICAYLVALLSLLYNHVLGCTARSSYVGFASRVFFSDRHRRRWSSWGGRRGCRSSSAACRPTTSCPQPCAAAPRKRSS